VLIVLISLVCCRAMFPTAGRLGLEQIFAWLVPSDWFRRLCFPSAVHA